jgi:hypothetical protein
MMQINLNNLLEFYDDKKRCHSYHVSAITGLIGEDLAFNFFKHYVENDLRGKIKRVELKCTQGARNGKRLDRWIHAEYQDKDIFFQTEIKNWSSHSLGGEKFPNDASHETMYRKSRWERVFDPKNQKFKSDNLSKVTIPMSLPIDWIEKNNISPLVIFWESMHSEGKSDPFFTSYIKSDDFEFIHIFSISTYVRNLIQSEIFEVDLDLGITSQRIALLNLLVK